MSPRPFQASNCGALPFAPQLTASAVGHGSKADGTTFNVTVRSGGVGPNGVVQAGIAKVDLQLPKQLSSRLPTLQKACLEVVFNANPASCPEGSVIGYATIHTPVLKNPLSGPAYLVSHGSAAFPDVEFVLQGEGIKLVLDGKTQIKSGITYSKFESAPDAPFTVFETVLPAGPHGVLTPNVAESKKFSLCGENLAMPTIITGQNGVVIEHSTKIAISGCGEVKSAKAKKLTLMQKLHRALLSCQHRYKHSKSRRVKCERQAHAHYTSLALTACRISTSTPRSSARHANGQHADASPPNRQHTRRGPSACSPFETVQRLRSPSSRWAQDSRAVAARITVWPPNPPVKSSRLRGPPHRARARCTSRAKPVSVEHQLTLNASLAKTGSHAQVSFLGIGFEAIRIGNTIYVKGNRSSMRVSRACSG